MKLSVVLVLLSAIWLSEAVRIPAGCATDDASNYQLVIVGNLGNDTWVRGHEGPIVSGEIRKEKKMKSTTVIKGNVDEENFEFEFEVNCNREEAGQKVCSPDKSEHRHEMVNLTVVAHIGYVSYELSLNDTTKYTEVNVTVGNQREGFCTTVAQFVDVYCQVPENLTPFQPTTQTEYDYNSEVAFKCKEENSYLNYHGEFADSFNSKCSSDKRWTNLQNAKCYTAPSNVSLEGSMSVNEGEVLNLDCSFKEGNPPAKSVNFHFGEITVTKDVHEKFTHKVQRGDDGKQISCDVTNEVTEHVTSSNQSPSRTIEVFYKPDKPSSPQNCMFKSSNEEEFLNQNISCKITFDTNPKVTDDKLAVTFFDNQDEEVGCLSALTTDWDENKVQFVEVAPSSAEKPLSGEHDLCLMADSTCLKFKAIFQKSPETEPAGMSPALKFVLVLLGVLFVGGCAGTFYFYKKSKTGAHTVNGVVGGLGSNRAETKARKTSSDNTSTESHKSSSFIGQENLAAEDLV